MSDTLGKIRDAVADLDLDAVEPLVKDAVAAEEEPNQILEAMGAGMARVGELFEEGEYFLADLVLAGEMMKEGVAVIESLLAKSAQADKGTVVLCTVKGDIHDIGKNLVGTMLSSAGIKVVDLGVDVHWDKVVEAVKSSGAKAVALSVLLTTTATSIGDIVAALTEAGLRDQVKIAIGGACTTPELAERMQVDAIGRDAVEAVRIFEGWPPNSPS
jgi:5-methyltetrahydrofolate--homocysteine methyltransferase